MNFTVKVPFYHERKVPEPWMKKNWRDHCTADHHQEKRYDEALEKLSKSEIWLIFGDVYCQFNGAGVPLTEWHIIENYYE